MVKEMKFFIVNNPNISVSKVTFIYRFGHESKIESLLNAFIRLPNEENARRVLSCLDTLDNTVAAMIEVPNEFETTSLISLVRFYDNIEFITTAYIDEESYQELTLNSLDFLKSLDDKCEAASPVSSAISSVICARNKHGKGTEFVDAIIESIDPFDGLFSININRTPLDRALCGLLSRYTKAIQQDEHGYLFTNTEPKRAFILYYNLVKHLSLQTGHRKQGSVF